MKIAYAIWLEDLNSPILRGQVIEILKKINKISPQDKLYLFAFQYIQYITLHRQKYRLISIELKDSGINLIIIPSLILPKVNSFSAKWYIVPLIFLQSFPTLLFLIFIKKIDILHCRSYPITLAAIAVKKLIKHLKIIFDPRSAFPEENITAGRWTEKSFTFKVWKRLEKKYLDESDITIAIANTYVKHFRKISYQSDLVIIPNNVDVARFVPDKEIREHFRFRMGISDDEIIFVYSGSMSNHWNNPKIYAKFLIKLRELDIKHRFLFLTPNIEELKKTFERYSIKPEEYIVLSTTLEDVPKYLSMADFGLNLMEREDIRVSIKTVEYLSMRLPIITNSNVLGAKEIAEQYGVGLVLGDLENINLRGLKDFIKKKDQLSLKCRKVACENFSTEKVAKQYVKVYKKQESKYIHEN